MNCINSIPVESTYTTILQKKKKILLLLWLVVILLSLRMKKWSSQWTQFMQLCKEAWKNSGLQRGSNPWPRDTGAMLYQVSYAANVMHCAVESGNNTILRVLLAAGVNPNVIEGCGISLLHLAALGKSILTCAKSWLTGLRQLMTLLSHQECNRYYNFVWWKNKRTWRDE